MRSSNNLYRRWSSSLLLLLMLLANKSQAVAGLDCACWSPKTTTSCCAKKASPKKSCARADQLDHAPIQLSSCCCDGDAQWELLVPSQEKTPEAVSSSTPWLPALDWSALVASKAYSAYAIAPQEQRPYAPPLLYRDVPIFVQSFLL